MYLEVVIVLLQLSLQVRLDRVLDHVLEEQPVFGHSLERLYEVRLKREWVADSLGDVCKELDPSFVHQPRLLGHVLKVHGVVE